jgi:hypothetical protein
VLGHGQRQSLLQPGLAQDPHRHDRTPFPPAHQHAVAVQAGSGALDQLTGHPVRGDRPHQPLPPLAGDRGVVGPAGRPHDQPPLRLPGRANIARRYHEAVVVQQKGAAPQAGELLVTGVRWHRVG